MECVNSPYDKLLYEVAAQGEPVDSRMGPALEVRDLVASFRSGALVHRKGINYRLGWMEALQILAGTYDPEQIKRVAPNADHSLFTEQMAYGPPVAARMPGIIQALRDDPLTRQAVLYIGDSSKSGTAGLACTLTMQFLIRSGWLHASVFMRSWDLIKGLPYDLMMFSAVHKAAARILRLMPGRITVHAGSAHIYDSDCGKVPSGKGASWALPMETDNDGPFEDWADWQIWASKRISKKWIVPDGVVVWDPDQIIR